MSERIRQDSTTLPAVIRNPSILSTMARNMARVEAPRPIFGTIIPIEEQLRRDYLDALREEVESVEPVLLNVYRDSDLLALRDAALTEIIHVLLSIEEAASSVLEYGAQREALGAEIRRMLEFVSNVAREARYKNLPVLTPFQRLTSVMSPGSLTNRADIVWVVSSAPDVVRETQAICASLPILHAELVDFGVVPQYGIQAFGHTSTPGGPFSADMENIRESLMRMPVREAPQHSLSALCDLPMHFNFRTFSNRIAILITDESPADDWGNRRGEAIRVLTENNITLFALSVTDRFDGRPFEAFLDLSTVTGGGYINFAVQPWNDVMVNLGASIASAIAGKGVGTTPAMDRMFPVGPGNHETVVIRFPDLSLEALGLTALRLESREDFVDALSRVGKAIETLAGDRKDKLTLLNYLRRIVTVFNDARAFRLDFHI